MKKMMLATLLVLILQPFPALSQSSRLLSVQDYFPAELGNFWIRQYFSDPTAPQLFGLKVLDQFKCDSLAYILSSGPLGCFGDPMSFCGGWFAIKFSPPSIILEGAAITDQDPFIQTGNWLDISDSTKLISLDSTVTCPCGTFYHCIVDQRGLIWAPGFGPVSENLVYAKVNGIEYGTMPKPEVTPKSYTVYDYFPPTPGNIWVRQYRKDHDAGNYFGLKVLEHFQDDTLVYLLGSGPSDCYGNNEPMHFCFNTFRLRFNSSTIIMQGVADAKGVPFIPVSPWLDISDSTRLISLDSTVTCPAGTFYHCIIDQRGGAWAPGFGPVLPNLVYAKVNEVEYGTMPTASAVESDRPQNAPRGNALYPAYPNPFNQSTGISFNLNKPGPARLTIYDIQGRVVRVLLDEQAAAGSHYLTWDGMTDDSLPCPSGVYFVFLKSAEYSQKRALTLVR